MSRPLPAKKQKLARSAKVVSRTLKTGAAGANLLEVKKLEELAARIRTCVECPLHQTRTLAVPGSGKGNARVMIIGEAPGKDEDKTGLPFVGSAGKYLDHVMEGTSIRREDFFITNIVKCRPPGNRTPKSLEVGTCTTLYLRNQIALINPKLIVLLGSTAVKALLGVAKVDEVRCRIVEHEGQRFLATYHPAVRFYREDLAVKIKEDFGLLRKEMQQLAKG